MIRKRFFIVLVLLVVLLPELVSAQRWKRQRYEFSFGLGVSNFLGELGGANQIGTHYFRDLEFSQTRLAAAVGLRYKLSNYFAFKSNLTYGRVSGDDALTDEKFRSYRNLRFFSDIYEFNINFEGAFQQEQIGHRYRLKRVKGLRGYEIYTYAFVGAGVFYFDPKTELHGQVYRLRDFRTEGQGLVPSRKEYSLLQFVIPLGVGFKYTIDRTWGVGLELGIRKTFTDYIDDVSTTYFDFAAYTDQVEPLTLVLADRSDMTQPNITSPGNQRGDPRFKDSYMFAIFSLNYKIKTGRNNLPRF